MTAFILTILAQVPESPKEYDNAWQWVAGALLVVGIALVTYLAKENKNLNMQISTDAQARAVKWEEQAKTCAADFGKTSDALKVANDATVIMIGKIDKLTESQDKLNEKLDRYWDRMGVMTSRLDRFQSILERLSGRNIPSEET